MLTNQSYRLLLLYALILLTRPVNGSEEPSDWLVRQNARVTQNPQPSLSDEEKNSENSSNRKKPFFKLDTYENITKRITEKKMAQLLSEAPSSLKETKTNLMKNETGPLSGASILLDGPSGTGKSSLAFSIAYKCKCPYISIVGSRLANSFKNSAPEFIEALFKALRSKGRNALIIDEFTAFTAKLNNHNDGDTGAVEDFWTALELHQQFYSLIFIATTNELDKIPTPFRDRFWEVQYIGNPSKTLRLSILNDSALKPHCNSQDLEQLADQTEGFSLRDLEMLYKKAQGKANVRDPHTKANTLITAQDIQDALQSSITANRSKTSQDKIKTNNQKWENFNRFYLPLIGVGSGLALGIATMLINSHLNQTNHAEMVEIQNHQFKRTEQTNASNFNITLEQNRLHNNNALMQGASIAIGNATADAVCAFLPGGFVVRPFLIFISIATNKNLSNISNIKN